MNSDIRRFIQTNNINVSQINKELMNYIYTPKEINSITAEYGLYSGKSEKLISISKILGYDRDWRGISSNIIDSLDNFFNSNGSTYCSRSVGLLEYDKNTILPNLERSFEIDPIYVDECDKDKYVISTNGLHRYSVLRVHYLSEVCNAKDNGTDLEEVDKKYQIPVLVGELDYIKTYCRFLLQISNSVKRVESELDKKYDYTGNVELTDLDNEKIVFNNEQLLEFTKMKMSDLIDNPFYSAYIQSFMNKYETFNEFMVHNFEEFTRKLQEERIDEFRTYKNK